MPRWLKEDRAWFMYMLHALDGDDKIFLVPKIIYP